MSHVIHILPICKVMGQDRKRCGSQHREPALKLLRPYDNANEISVGFSGKLSVYNSPVDLM